jgi:hypothetical protein
MSDYEEEAKHVLLSVIDVCSGCRHPYQPEDVEVISRNGDMWFFSLTCSLCQSRAMVAAAITQERNRESIGPLGPQGPASHGPVTQEDVERVRAYLEGFDGNFKRLFGN